MLGVLVGPQVTVANVALGTRVDVAMGSFNIAEKALLHGCCPAVQSINSMPMIHDDFTYLQLGPSQSRAVPCY